MAGRVDKGKGEAGGGRHRVGDEEDIRLGVAEGAEPVIVLLPSSVPQRQVDGLAVHHNRRAVVVEDGRDVLCGETVCRVAHH